MRAVLASPLGFLVGLSLGALGGGGSILAVPALVYGAGQDPKDATTTSLLLVMVMHAAGSADSAKAAGLLAILRTWEGSGHVPYSQHRTQILTETRNFFYSQMDLAHAAR